jgi:peptidoglycan/xylan/chitin deacetylase (PgdA/CDA1 family)
MLFHRVTDEVPEDGLTVSPARFERMCQMLQRSFRVVPLAEALRLIRSAEPIRRRTVAITFDDSYRDNLLAARVLARYGLPACFFVPTAFIGTRRVFDWDRGLQRLPNLTWDDVREIARMGFEIGSHTMSHPNLAALSHDETRTELIGSKEVIERQLGTAVRWFAYPFGGPNDFRPDQVPLIEETGYEACLSGYGGFIQPGSKERVLPREPIPYFQSLLNLELHLSGCLQWFYALKQGMGWRRDVEEQLPEHACGLYFATEKAAGPKILQ